MAEEERRSPRGARSKGNLGFVGQR